MTPIKFPEANATFNPPPDMKGLCESVTAYCGHVEGGTNDGAKICVTAWRPTLQEIEAMRRGQPIFVSFIGGLPPHFVTTDFQQSIHPA